MRTRTLPLLTAAALLGACGGAPGGRMAPSTSLEPAARSVDVDDTSLDFTREAGAALAALAVEVPASLRDAVGAHADAAAHAEDCARYPEADRVFALDLDGDDAPDGLATYTLEGCGGGNHYRRMLVVLRGGGDAWRLALDAVLGAKHATRRIHSIAAGALVLGPSGDAPGASEAAPEILSLPPAEGPLP